MKKYLPLPTPWTVDTLSEYVDALVNFITEYKEITTFSSTDSFIRPIPIDWAAEYSLEEWIAIHSGEFTGNLPEQLSKFVKRSRELPLVDTEGPIKVQEPINRKRCCRKKDYELEVLRIFVPEMAEVHNITAKNILDVGSGKGHLAQVLSEAGYEVVCIEGDPGLACKTSQTSKVKCVAQMVGNHTDLDIIQQQCITVSLRISDAGCN
jgi:Methyltransferase domain